MKPLGTPLPNDPHAVSVSMPLWQDVVDYEEANPRVINALQTGYPRFFYHPFVAALCKRCEEQFATEGETCLVFPLQTIAEQCAAYLLEKADVLCRLQELEGSDAVAVLFPSEAKKIAKEFWQHAGLILSSRQAEAILQSEKIVVDAAGAKQLIKQRIADIVGEGSDNVTLYPSGMGAIFSAYQAVCALQADAKTIQLGFPYVDTLKIQEKFGSGVHFLNYHHAEDLKAVEAIVKHEKIAGLFCEIPSNPLLNVIDLPALSSLLRRYGVPLIIDDTVGTAYNIDLLPYADIIVTSLTKFFSGTGDVLGGSLLLASNAPFHAELSAIIAQRYEDVLYSKDALILEQNSRNLAERIKQINVNAEGLCDYLSKHSAIERVYYPKYTQVQLYDLLKKKEGGYGGLFSFLLKDTSKAPIVYDHLAIEKGPSLGTNFTLACPYTLLAHYQELDFAKTAGVSPSLIRVSVGLEESSELIKRFKSALECIK